MADATELPDNAPRSRRSRKAYVALLGPTFLFFEVAWNRALRVPSDPVLALATEPQPGSEARIQRARRKLPLLNP